MNFLTNFFNTSENTDDDNTDSKMSIKKINLFINHSILLNYFKSYINDENNKQKDKCEDIQTILSKKFYNKLNINNKEIILLDTIFMQQRKIYKDKINELLNEQEKKTPASAPAPAPAPVPAEAPVPVPAEAPAPAEAQQLGGAKENNIKKSICEYINYSFYNYYVLLHAYYMFHNYKINITNKNINSKITDTNIFFKFIKYFINNTSNIDGENINIENIKTGTINITEFIDLLKYDTSYNNVKAITDFKCSIRSNAIEIIKNGKERLFFNKTFKYQLLNETNEKKNGSNLYEMEQELKNYDKTRIVNYGIKKQIIEFNKNYNNLINKNDTSNLCYLKNKILKLKIEVNNKIIKDKKYIVNLETVKTDIKKLIDTYLKKKDELYENLIENKIFNISNTKFKYIEDVILYELHNKSLNTIKYNTEKIFYEFFIEFYKTLIKILKLASVTEADAETDAETDAEAEAEADAETDAEAEAEAETDAEAEAEVSQAEAKVSQAEAKVSQAEAKVPSIGGRKKIKTKRIKKFKRRKTRRKTRRKN
jgi:hypothetical protein